MLMSRASLDAVIMAFSLPARTKSEHELITLRKQASNSPPLCASHGPSEGADHSAGMGMGADITEQLGAAASLRRALLSPRMISFLFEMWCVGAFFTVVEKFLFVYVLRELGGSQSLCGYSVAVTVLFELPLFHYGKSATQSSPHLHLHHHQRSPWITSDLDHTQETKS